MPTWSSICRICASPGNYEIFAKIPTYLHGHYNEIQRFQKPISQMIEEITGLKISKDDNLPKNICALCVSYLKHAVIFREQCINTSIHLETALNYCGNVKKDKPKTTEKTINENVLLRDIKTNKKFTDLHLPFSIKYLDTLFDKKWKTANIEKSNQNTLLKKKSISYNGIQTDVDDSQTATSSDGVDEITQVNKKFFTNCLTSHNSQLNGHTGYQKTNNQTTSKQLLLDGCLERKCKTCLRRYMLPETYEDHINTCLESKLVTFIEEVKRLNSIRRFSISPNEFICGVIINIQKICVWLKKHHSDILLPDLIAMNIHEKLSNDTYINPKTDENVIIHTTNNIPYCITKNNSKINNNNNILYEIENSSQYSEMPSSKISVDVCSATLTSNLQQIITTSANKTHSNSYSYYPISFLHRLHKSINNTSKKQLSYDTESDQIQTFRSNVIDHKNHFFNHSLVQDIQDESIIKTYQSDACSKTEDKNNIQLLENINSDQKNFSENRQISIAAIQINNIIRNITNKQRSNITPTKSFPLQNITQLSSPAKGNITPVINPYYAARCDQCSLVFKTLGNFEQHNAKHHNAVAKMLTK